MRAANTPEEEKSEVTEAIGSNCPGISGTVPDLMALSRVCPECFTTVLLFVLEVVQTTIIICG